MGEPDREPCEEPAAVRVWIAEPRGAPAPRVFGLSGAERLRRALAGRADVIVAAGPGPPAGGGGPAVVLRADVLYDARLLDALLATHDVVVEGDAPEGPRALAASLDAGRLGDVAPWLAGAQPPPLRDAPAGLRAVRPDDLVDPYDARLRKRQPTWARRVAPGAEAEAERFLFDAAYKGVTDVVTKHVWPRPALGLTRALAARGVSPNAVTAWSWALVILATALFATGRFGVGLAAAWVMTFLDTVDGKLARVTLRSSRVGHVLDHGLDLVHPPIWYLAFAWPLLQGGPAWVEAATAVVLGGYLLGRLLEGVFLAVFGFEIHSWRPADSAFRLVTARRNPNLLLLTAGAVAGRPAAGLAAVAVWTALSCAFHTVRLLQAFAARRTGALRSWQEVDAPRAHPAPLDGTR